MHLCIFKNISKVKFKYRKGLIRTMKKIIMFKVYKEEKYFIAECVDLPVVTQGKTLDEVVENVKEAIALHFEGEDVKEWDILSDYSILVNLELEPVHAKT